MSAKVHAPTVRQQVMAPKKKAKLSINDQLRSLIGDILSEKELKQRLTFGRVLGTGATSKVYEAVDTRTGEKVSVKVFDKAAMVEARRSMVADGNYVAEKAVHRVRRRLLKLVSELEISKSLDHPNIIKYVGAYETSHRICIIHELVEGSDLLEHLLANGKMPEDQAAGVFKQLLSALEYCHARNVFHRDLKLENVMITKDLKVKLIDFGLSEVVANPEQPLKTVCGTPLYCSPEILFLHTTAQTAREGFRGGPADVWSVGVLIFALLTGCAPFDDSDFKRLRRGISRNRINYPDYISDQAKGLLKAVLVTDPLMRPSVTDLLSYGWFQDSDASPEEDTSVVTEKNAATQKMENDWLCAKRQGDNNDDIRCRSLSCRHASDLDGTYSSNASLEDSIKRCPSSPTHFSSMENEVEKGASKV
ncbi:hypothetical protein BBJ29_006832 [Phytophthora kernoviae]|uniref:Protein kinase domain-containing protein n=1 Tax=Phytophthora kernoviae TaxID=325452 RepID=A0A3F2S1Z3_9STRA|nr:hypothetical protein BBJ29_006832 [Phytophthora kernoviae]RLN67913.1 hypothetical protein BBP00_00001357 [Phytophthora kernoviae]